MKESIQFVNSICKFLLVNKKLGLSSLLNPNFLFERLQNLVSYLVDQCGIGGVIVKRTARAVDKGERVCVIFFSQKGEELKVNSPQAL